MQVICGGAGKAIATLEGRVLDCEKRCKPYLNPAGTKLQELRREMLVRLGEDPERDGLQQTPERMERSMKYLTKGYQENPEELLLDAMFDVAYERDGDRQGH